MNARKPINPTFSEWEFLGQRILMEITKAKGGAVTTSEVCAAMLCGVHPHLINCVDAPEINRLLARLRKNKPTWTRHLLNKIGRWWNTTSYAGRARRGIVCDPVYLRQPSRIITTIEATNGQLQARFGSGMTDRAFIKMMQRIDRSRPPFMLSITKKLNLEISRLKAYSDANRTPVTIQVGQAFRCKSDTRYD